jgi:dual-specificity kinase
MECLAEMPHAPLDRRPRKRQRLGWDVGPEIAQVLPPIPTRFDL